jgi:hypothetical protein
MSDLLLVPNALSHGVAGDLLLYTGFSETRYTPFGYLFVPKGSLNFPSFIFHSEKAFDGQLILARRADASNSINSELTISSRSKRSNLRSADDLALD